MSGLWNFSVRVQSWSDKIESDPVLIHKIFENHQSDPVPIREGKIIYPYFASWGKRTTGAIVPFAKYCCDRKSQAAYVQSFALWQQATIEFTCHDHSSRTLLLRSIVDIVSITSDFMPRSLYYCLFAPHICMVLFFTHIPFMVNHTFNATPPGRLQQYHWLRAK